MSLPYKICFASIALLTLALTPAFGQEDAAEAVVDAAAQAVELAEEAVPALEEAMPAVADVLPEDLIPVASGFAFGGLDPEALENSNMLIWQDGKMTWNKGTLTADDTGSVAYSGQDGSDANAGVEAGDWFANPINRLMLLAICKWLALSAVIGWPIAAFILRGTLYADDSHDPTTGSRFFWVFGWLTSLLVLVIMTGLFLIAIHRPALWMGAPNIELSHIKPLVWGLIGGVAFCLLGSVLAWAKGFWRIPGRIHYTLTTLGALIFLWFLIKGSVVPEQLAQLLG